MGQLRAVAKQTHEPDGRQAGPRPEAPSVERQTWHLTTSLLCTDIANSTTHNTPVIYQVLMAIVADRFPYRHPVQAAMFWIFDEPGTYRVAARLITPAGEVLVEDEADSAIEEPGVYWITQFVFGELDFPVPGRYRLEVCVQDRPAGAYPLDVIGLPRPDVEETKED